MHEVVTVAVSMETPGGASMEMECSCGEILFEGISTDMGNLEALKWRHWVESKPPVDFENFTITSDASLDYTPWPGGTRGI